MVTILLEQIIEILKGWLSSFTSWAEDTAEKLGLIEEATEYIDDIYDETTQIQANTSNIATSNTMIQGYSLNISNKTNNIDTNVTAIKNNVGSIATSSGAAAAFAEDCATNGLNILDKVTTIASDTTQLRADNTVVKSDLDKIYDALKWSLVGVDTTETEEGIGYVSFDTDKAAALSQFDIAFEPIQLGTGDPSPSNPIAISGWSDFDVNANGAALNIALGSTYYNGTVDTITGAISADKKLVTFTGAASESWVKTTGNFFYIAISDALNTDARTEIQSNIIQFVANPSAAWQGYLRNGRLYVNTDGTLADAAAMKTWLASNNMQVVYPLANNITATATNTLSISSIKGLNTITSDSNGTMTVTYTESVKHYLDKQEG